MATLGDLVANLKVDSRQFDSGLGKARGSLGSFVKSATKGLANLNLATGAVKAMFGEMVEPLQLAQQQIASEKKLAQAIKSTGNAAQISLDEIKAYASERQNLTNFGDEGTIDAAGVLASFTGIKGKDIFTETLTRAQDLSAFLGTDLQSSVLKLGKALNDPARGISALAESGIQFSKSQMEQIKRLQEIGDLASAQKLILAELQTQFGGQAEALVDPLQQVTNAFGDMKEQVGFVLRDVIIPLLPTLIDGFTLWGNTVKGIADELSGMANKFQEFAFMATALGSGMDFQEAQQAYIDAFSIKDQANVGGIAGALKIGMDKQAEKEQIASDAAKVVEDKKVEAAAVMQAEKVMAGFVRSGLEGLTTAYMGLGPAAVESKQSNMDAKVGSLEANSQASFDVLRANIGGPDGKGKIQEKQLSEQQKQTGLLQKAVSLLGRPTNGFEIKGFDS